MRYYCVREITKNGRASGLYKFTGGTGKHIHAVGYCAEDCQGHDTEMGAREHYHEYLVDHATYGETCDSLRKCRVPECEAWTSRYAQVGECQIVDLCKKHCNKEGIMSCTNPPSEIWAC